MNLSDDSVWTFNVSWQAVTGVPGREVDVASSSISELVTTDADFVFYIEPVSQDGAVRIAENGSSE